MHGHLKSIAILTTCALLATAALALAPASARADVMLPGSYTSNDSRTGAPPVGPIDVPEPVRTGAEFTLKNLNFTVQSGYVVLLERGDPNNPAYERAHPEDWSDIAFFTNVNGHGIVAYASDGDDGTTALQNLIANGYPGPTTDDTVIFQSENPNSPVNLYESTNLEYILRSAPPETTPEPSSLALLGIGALGLVGFRFRRRR